MLLLPRGDEMKTWRKWQIEIIARQRALGWSLLAEVAEACHRKPAAVRRAIKLGRIHCRVEGGIHFACVGDAQRLFAARDR